MRAVFSVVAFAAFLFPAAVYSQDLGSANKLFGGPKKESAAKAPKRPATSKSSPKRPVSVKKARTANQRSASQVVSGSKPAGSASEADNKPTAAVLQKFEMFLAEGNAARDARSYAAAQAAYENARVLLPQDARAAIGLGSIFSDRQLWDQAEQQYRTALRLSPDDPWVHIALSYVLSQPIVADDLAGRYAEAERLARRATELAPKNALAFDRLGVAMELRGLIGAETENAYLRAVELDPSFAPAYAHLGRLMHRRGMAAKAQSFYSTAISKATQTSTMILVAEVLQSEQRFRESEGLLRQAIERDPYNHSALLLLSRALLTLERYSESETLLRKSLEKGANGFRTHMLLASLNLRKGNIPLAENALLQALRDVPSNEKAILAEQFEAVGDAYDRSGKTAEAERCYRQALTLDRQRTSAAAKIGQPGKVN
ncbi:MAG: tetratricopeptide repeat protein [Acidobacteriota bacterium]|nr:MAG: tetratricopeptide repeat protein [Acidobacteriota bacterium]